ncbi:hypothetical protein D910_05193 [Dendroctonus ponderosae]|uniref:DDE Tnp4 domain-containing protein n=1 Tax=Dendroctonus ponderosae TaxID=77166 RepID=U4U1R5_DENPD|nr:hypothetical protein D910_05193 [Dendroctonus ponderosae]
MLPQEIQYNTAHIATRNTVERTFGVCKRLFSCLATGLTTDIEELTLPLLVAAAVLHNIAIRRNDVEDFEEINCNAEVNDIFEEENEGGPAVRRACLPYRKNRSSQIARFDTNITE